MIRTSGLIMSGRTVPDSDHLVRYVQWARLRKDENDVVLGVLGAAFSLRPGEPYLSATWAEHSNPRGSPAEQINAAIRIIRGDMKVSPKSGFAIGQVAAIKEATKSALGRAVSVVHEPEPSNQSHVALKGWPNSDSERIASLFETLATEAWADLVLNKDVL